MNSIEGATLLTMQRPKNSQKKEDMIYTDNFNAYLALSNFSNFTTNTHGTPNTPFSWLFFSKLGRKKWVIGIFLKLKGKKTPIM